jgi:hypothetical protein
LQEGPVTGQLRRTSKLRIGKLLFLVVACSAGVICIVYAFHIIRSEVYLYRVRNGNIEERFFAAEWLVSHKVRRILPEAIECLRVGDVHAKYYALSVIERMGPLGSEAVPAVLECLNDEMLTLQCIKTLSAIGPGAKTAKGRLVDLAGTGSRLDIREAATKVIEQFEAEQYR